MINKIYCTLALLMFSGLVNAFTVFTNKTDWENALSGAVVITEDFEDQTMVDGLASYTIFDGTFTELQDFNLIAPPTFSTTQVFEENANVDGTTIWSFSSPSIAFGGNWDLSPAMVGPGLAVKINDIIQTFGISNSHVDGDFWGFIAEEGDPAFLTVELLRPGAVGSEVYHLDNMVFAGVVPIPAAIWLLGSGLIGLLGYKKHYHTKFKRAE